ncbi:hydrogenase expression/formation protein [Sphaerotilus microaerophilus]|uniref:Hydrogenase expression/formation protein n=1 Tax=Sphaerotilus microaerophilus TaxID=2914710 RepID=A0ABM7YK30_9BURK|nr:hydrogenase expression/formation protein [Sphaerotilus sp. FB-5]BDI04773.1 hydrogenase expression/formation protein [Sphaerotilus sp. FB-5]
MSLPYDPKSFPIPVVALGAGSQSEDEGLDYLSLPQGMATFQPPPLPEPEAFAGHGPALRALHEVHARLQALLAGQAVEPVRLEVLGADDLALIHQVLGEGEVSAQVLAEPGAPGQAHALPRVQIQESVFAGVWRVIERSDDGLVRDHIEVGPVPAILRQAARDDARAPLAPLQPLPPGVLNAPAILAELAEHRLHWRAGQSAEVVNLSLLPVTPEDIAYIDHIIGTGRVVILSRGYGNCRITNAAVDHTWRVVYYNSQDAVILNAVEVVDLPEVACAATEDLADSAERLTEVLQWVEQA